MAVSTRYKLVNVLVHKTYLSHTHTITHDHARPRTRRRRRTNRARTQAHRAQVTCLCETRGAPERNAAALQKTRAHRNAEQSLISSKHWEPGPKAEAAGPFPLFFPSPVTETLFVQVVFKVEARKRGIRPLRPRRKRRGRTQGRSIASTGREAAEGTCLCPGIKNESARSEIKEKYTAERQR